jgi:hypothetical protein
MCLLNLTLGPFQSQFLLPVLFLYVGQIFFVYFANFYLKIDILDNMLQYLWILSPPVELHVVNICSSICLVNWLG